MRSASRRAALVSLALLACGGGCGGSAFTAASSSGDDGGASNDATVDSGDDASPTHDASVDSPPPPPAGDAGGCRLGSDCSTGFCKSGTCAPCTVNPECGANQFCDAVSGVCKPTKANGVVCAGNGECTSSFCADLVCCNTACSGTCESCNTAAAPGTCTPTPAGMNGVDRPCSSGEVCCPESSGGATSCTSVMTTVNCGGCGISCTTPGPCSMAMCVQSTCVSEPSPQGTACGDGGVCNGTGICL